MKESRDQEIEKITASFESFKAEVLASKDREIEELQLQVTNLEISIQTLEDAKDR